MKIREDREVAIRKVAPLNERISRQYGVSIDLSSDLDHLQRVLEHYSEKRNLILDLTGETAALQNKNYAKAVLISETVKMFLREIAPKRTRKKKTRKPND